jgi:hypothetical protein
LRPRSCLVSVCRKMSFAFFWLCSRGCVSRGRAKVQGARCKGGVAG